MLIIDEIKKIKSGKKQLREFGIVMGVFFGILAGLACWRHKFWIHWAGVSVFFFAFGLAIPQALKPLQKAWMTLAVLIGFVMSRVILSLLFFIALTPLSVLSRLTGKKFMTSEQKNDSYWIPLNQKTEQNDYLNQF